MNLKLLIASLFVTLSTAWAQSAADRVILVPTTTACPGLNTQFVTVSRLTLRADGTSAVDVGEYTVPAGKLLDVRTVDYDVVLSGVAQAYTAGMSVRVKSRSTTASWELYGDSLKPSRVHGLSIQAGMAGAQTGWSFNEGQRTASLSPGFLVGPGARVCVARPTSGFILVGDVRVMGVLVDDPSASPVAGGSTGTIGSVSTVSP